MTEEARRGLLDPVIGRDDVIQRTLQVCHSVITIMKHATEHTRAALLSIQCIQTNSKVSSCSQDIFPRSLMPQCWGETGAGFPRQQRLWQHRLCCTAHCCSVHLLATTSCCSCWLLPLLQVLLRRAKHNPLLIGEAGVGKTAIVEGLAQLMASQETSITG
jgi:ATP-dependent Clp protease ATP-binding subunit ClpA